MLFYDNYYCLDTKLDTNICDIKKLYPDRSYLLVMHDDIRRGVFQNLTYGNCNSECKVDCYLNKNFNNIHYYGMYFLVGNAKYDAINLKDQIHQYHLQSHISLENMQLKIYDYPLNNNIQLQIKKFWYKKYFSKFCNDFKIPSDIELIILSFI
jgi:hypothetical protein